MKVVLDTNIWLSGLFWEGEASRIIGLAEKRKFKVLISKEIILEIIDVLNKEAKFQRFIENREQKIEDLVRTILSISELTETETQINIIEHAADNMILELAIDGKADYIISYNKHILNLREFKGIKILTPEDFLKIIR